MSRKNILIISTEGQESNTEILFYRGLALHVQKLKAYAIGKLSEGKNKKEKFKGRFLDLVRTLGNLIDEETHIFFIGDGDIKADISSMQRAMDYFTSWINKNKIKWSYYKELIYDKGMKFEDILRYHPSLKNSKHLSRKSPNLSNEPQKKRSNVWLFNNLIDEIDKNILLKKGDISLEKVLKDIFKDSNFLEIIKEVYN